MLLVAFLRGINVGGKNIVKSDQLRQIFSELGFKPVSIVKQSGNIIFKTNSEDLEKIAKRIQTKLNDVLGLNVSVFIRTIAQIKEIVQSNPFEDTNEESASFLVTFLSEEPKGLEPPIRIPNSTADIVLKRDKEVYSITRGHGDGGKPNPYIEKMLKTQATTRNWNIINEIARTQ